MIEVNAEVEETIDYAAAIEAECDAIKALLLEKNKCYGNSAFEPLGIFARDMQVEDMIRVRIDDKLSRIKKGREWGGEDTILDLIGYLILLRIATPTCHLPLARKS
jgi:hypothetical protein